MKFVCQGRRSAKLQKPVRRNEKYKKRVYTLLWREKSEKRARLRVQLACKGHGFIDKALKKGYNQTREWAGCCTAKNSRTA